MAGTKQKQFLVLPDTNLKFLVKIEKMQDDPLVNYKPHQCCPECSQPVGKKDYCKNESCKFNAELPSKLNQVRTFEKLKIGQAAETVYPLSQIDACKATDKEQMVILGKEPKNFDKTRIMGCYYVLPVEMQGRNKRAFDLLIHAIKETDNVLTVRTGRTGSEKIGILSFENGNLNFFEVAYTHQIRQPSINVAEVCKIDAKTTAKAKAWMKSIEEFNSTHTESQTEKNFAELLEGKPITPEQIQEEILDDADEMFAVADPPTTN